MKKRLSVLFLSGSICGLLGCASPKAITQADTSDVTTKPDDSDVAKEYRPRRPTPIPEAKLEQEKRVATALERNQHLSSVVKPLLPPGTNITDAATGFKKQKDFVAALHMAKNLGIPFNEIKTRMTTGHRMSLDESLRDIRPETTKNLARAEAQTAEEQAKADEKLGKDEAKKAAAQEKLAANRK
jgi:hypothetical protein